MAIVSLYFSVFYVNTLMEAGSATGPRFIMFRKLFLVAFMAVLVACGAGDYQLHRVYVENSHVHLVEVEHAHEFEVLDHSHADSELFPVSPVAVPSADASANPFSVIFRASADVLDLEGGRDLLRIAISPMTESQKLTLIMRSSPTPARALLLEAYIENEAIVNRLESAIDAARQ